MASLPCIGLIGPDMSQPCGIADYTARLRDALERRAELIFAPYREALEEGRFHRCRSLLVQYERSLMPDRGFLARLSRMHPGKVYVVPHEVYADDPFAFPYELLRSAFPPLLWLKRLRYRVRHREYARERALQRRGYLAHGIIPLSGPGADLLRAWAPHKVLAPVPLAFPDRVPEEEAYAADAAAYFPRVPRMLLGIFGFLNPGQDYAQILELLASLPKDVGLLILGGYRKGERLGGKLLSEAARLGLPDRVGITGYIPAQGLEAHFRLCDLFLAPLRFKSNSASLLHLFPLGKPILAADLPLTRYLREQGAPIDLYAGAAELRSKVEKALAGKYPLPANRYPWDFRTVAEAYLRILGG